MIAREVVLPQWWWDWAALFAEQAPVICRRAKVRHLYLELPNGQGYVEAATLVVPREPA